MNISISSKNTTINSAVECHVCVQCSSFNFRHASINRETVSFSHLPLPRPDLLVDSSPSWHCIAEHAIGASEFRPNAKPGKQESGPIPTWKLHSRATWSLTVRISCSSMQPSTSVLLEKMSKLAPDRRFSLVSNALCT